MTTNPVRAARPSIHNEPARSVLTLVSMVISVYPASVPEMPYSPQRSQVARDGSFEGK